MTFRFAVLATMLSIMFPLSLNRVQAASLTLHQPIVAPDTLVVLVQEREGGYQGGYQQPKPNWGALIGGVIAGGIIASCNNKGGRFINGQCVIRQKGCGEGYRNNSRGECIRIVTRCDEGYRKNSRGKCIRIVTRCDEGYRKNSRGKCIRIVTRCDEGYRKNSRGKCTRIVVLPPPIETPEPKIITVVCSGEPGAGPAVQVVGEGGNTAALARGSFPITYGDRERKLFPIGSLPAGVSSQKSSSNGALNLYADAYVDVPADPEHCKGTSYTGGELKLVDVPMERGGTAQACVQYCPRQTPPIIITSNDPNPPPPENQEPPGKPIVPVGTPAVPTTTATTYSEPPKRAVPTVIATPWTEPPKKAVPTVIAMPWTEPPRIALPTVVATPRFEPPRRAVPTVIATTRVEPLKTTPRRPNNAEKKRKAVPTVIATAYRHRGNGPKPNLALQTVKATSTRVGTSGTKQ